MRSEGLQGIGYLCSEFPALSHTFISREISILERNGFAISTVSINHARNLEKMGPEDRAFAARTYFIKGTSRFRALALLFRYAFCCPRFFAALGYAIRLTTLSGPRAPLKTAGYFVEAVLLHAWAREKGIEHLHVHFANPAATVALIATKLGGLDFSLSVHGPDEFYDVLRNNLREKIEAAVFVRCIGYYCRSQLMRLIPLEQWSKLHVVRCGIFKDEFQRRPFAPGPARRLLCVGRLCPSKGQAVLVEAARLLRDRGFDFQVLLLGGGEDLEAVGGMVKELRLADTVTLAGPVGHARVKEELAACDLFVLPSFAEGIPVALMEAMASGVPVVSTDIMGIPELVEHGVSGILVQPSNVEQLAAAIEPFLAGRADSRSLVEKAFEKVATMYDVEANTRMLADLFLSLRRPS
jgi:colanic acid/amylovoran biosynthesis glycosyltransferase